jgi:Tfp pilus assembly PilM family ATPase
LSRCIRQLGIVSLLERIAISFDISVSDAQTLLFQSTNQDEVEEPTRKTNAFSNPLHQKLCVYEQLFVAELERTVHFANRVTQTTMPAQILLMGPGVRISSLEKTIRNQVGLSTQAWSIDCSENLFGQQEIATYAVAAGLSALSWEAS